MLTRKTVIKKAVHIGSSTLLSRLLGLVREILMANYLGPGILGEAFITAFKIPNSLRKIFAEGALSVSFIPTFVQLLKEDGKKRVSRLTTLSLLLFEGFLLLLCLFCIWKADIIIRITMPGWFAGGGTPVYSFEPFRSQISQTILAPIIEPILHIVQRGLEIFTTDVPPSEQVGYAILFLRILMGFILFLSTSALLAGALQAAHNFFLVGFSPILLNVIFIISLIVCISFKLSPTFLCWSIMGAGLIQMLLHIFTYYRLNFSLTEANAETWRDFKQVWRKFVPCLVSMSILEIYLFIDTSLGSYLPTGSVALIYYANRFMQIPLGVVATALSTILLPYFSRIGVYAPKRLGFYLLESAKVIVWVMIPISLFMGLVSKQLFYTLFLSPKFTLWHVDQAAIILNASLYGIVFFSLNKILLNIYYGLHETKIPLYISMTCVFLNGVLSYYLMGFWGAYGIALGTSLAGAAQTLLSLIFLRYHFKFTFYFVPFMHFLMRFLIQLTLIGSSFLAIYFLLFSLLTTYISGPIAHFLLSSMGFWCWYIPLAISTFLLLWKTRTLFGIHMHFLDA